MKKNSLGYTSEQLTVIGLGTWAIGGPWKRGWGPQDDNDSVAAIEKSLEVGINWIDTAAIYGLGHSEEVIGRALKGMSEKPFIATKCGLRWDAGGQPVNCLKKNSIREECEASLRRLELDVIDLYQMHWPVPDEDVEEGWEEMARLADEGKVRYIGVSNFSVSQMERASRIHRIASFQPNYSMLHRGVEAELLGYCADNDIGVITYSPMSRGLLTGKFSHEHLRELDDGDNRKDSVDCQEPQFSATLELVERLRSVAEAKGITLAQLAIAWVLRRREVTAAIAGARNAQQINDNAGASEIELGADELDKIEGFLSEWSEKAGLNKG